MLYGLLAHDMSVELQDCPERRECGQDICYVARNETTPGPWEAKPRVAT